MSKFFLCFSVLFLCVACSTNSTYQEANLETFIPQKTEAKPNFLELNGEKDWRKTNFPIACEWFDLERIVDGDTIIVSQEETQIRVRMIGIDTPESKKPGTKIQPFALEASRKLKSLFENETNVCLISDKIGDKYDHYGRKLAYVFTDDGEDLNVEMIKSGLAKGYFNFPFERKSEFGIYAEIAKKEKMGMWQGKR